MKEVKINPVKKVTAASIEKACKDIGLDITMRTELKSIDANAHWHLKKGKEKGVLEITLMLLTGEVILSCKDNRGGDWIEGAIYQLKKDL